MAENKLSASVAAKYDLVGMRPGQFLLPARFKGGQVDWTTMTVEQADALVAKHKDVKNPDGSTGFQYLRLKGKSADGK